MPEEWQEGREFVWGGWREPHQLVPSLGELVVVRRSDLSLRLAGILV